MRNVAWILVTCGLLVSACTLDQAGDQFGARPGPTLQVPDTLESEDQAFRRHMDGSDSIPADLTGIDPDSARRIVRLRRIDFLGLREDYPTAESVKETRQRAALDFRAAQMRLNLACEAITAAGDDPDLREHLREAANVDELLENTRARLTSAVEYDRSPWSSRADKTLQVLNNSGLSTRDQCRETVNTWAPASRPGVESALERACDRNGQDYSDDCDELAVRLEDRQPHRAVEFYERACTRGTFEACGRGLELIERESLRNDHPRRYARLTFGACKSGDRQACRDSQPMLSDIDDVNPTDSPDLYQMMCASGVNRACAQHFGTTPTHHAMFYYSTCIQGAPQGCFALALTVDRHGDALSFQNVKPVPDWANSEETSLQETLCTDRELEASNLNDIGRNCMRGDVASCVTFGASLLRDEARFEGPHVRQSVQRRQDRIEREPGELRDACESGDEEACLRAGIASRNNPDHYLDRACELGAGFGCYMSAVKAHIQGADRAEVDNLLITGCEHGDETSCDATGRPYPDELQSRESLTCDYARELDRCTDGDLEYCGSFGR